jgi:two-component system, OmpR family, response regulator
VKLLLVEDDARLAATLTRGLEATGLCVDVAGDGLDGLWMASEGDYDVVILDILLPGLNGFAVCHELRARDNWVPILVLTAKAGDLDETEAIETGADDYLTKPFSFAVLVARIGALSRRVAHRDRAIMSTGDLCIDVGARRAWRGDVELVLTSRQFDVLEFLVRRAGRVVSRDEILRGVWPYDFEGAANIVEVYVGRLRRQIDDPFGRHSIETLRGAGYRLAPDGG